MLITAGGGRPALVTAIAKIFGRAQIDGKTVSRPCRLASMVWPVRDASQEIPKPRLLADVPVSVSGVGGRAGHDRAGREQGLGSQGGREAHDPAQGHLEERVHGRLDQAEPDGRRTSRGVKEIDIPLKAAGSEVVLDLAALKTPPGEYALAFYGSAVAKYRYNPEAVKLAEEEQKKAEQEAIAVAEAARSSPTKRRPRPPEKKADAENAAKAAVEQAEGRRGRQGGRRQAHEGRDRRGGAQGHRRYRGRGTHPHPRQAQGQEMSAPAPTCDRGRPSPRSSAPGGIVGPVAAARKSTSIATSIRS